MYNPLLDNTLPTTAPVNRPLVGGPSPPFPFLPTAATIRGNSVAAAVDEDIKREYLQAYDAWQAQLQALHKVLLEGQPLEPPKLKGLLNREIRAKERYDRARRRLLGLPEEE